MKNKYCIIFLLIIISCDKTYNSQAVLNINNTTSNKCDISELLFDYKITPLETNDQCIIGDMAKYVCAYGYFYVSSGNEILKFDLDGNFCGKLSSSGNGPKEYLFINDYEIIVSNNRVEILVAHNRGISRYDATSFEYISEISIPYSVLQFKYISEDTIIIVTPSDYTFYLVDHNGNLRSPKVKNDPANLSHQLVQFTEIGGYIYYLIGGSDDALKYDPFYDRLSVVKFVNGIDNLLTRKDNIRYMEQFGYLKQPLKVQEDFTTVIIAQQNDRKTVLFTRSSIEEKMWIRDDETNDWVSYAIYPKSDINNDIIQGVSSRYLLSMASNYSQESFMQIIPADVLEGIEINGYIMKIDDNPIIMTYRLK